MSDTFTNTVPVVLAVNGQRIERFVRGSVSLSMLDPYGTFSLEYSAGSEAIAPGVLANQLASLSIADTTVIAGYIDDAQYLDAPDEVRYTVVGRSITQDLIDCTVDRKSFANRKLIDIVRALVAPFEINLDVGPELAAEAPIPTFRTEKGESVFDAIQRACTLQKYFAYATGPDLSIRDIDTSPLVGVPLERGVNVVSTYRTVSMGGRYSDYLFAAQAKSTDDASGKNATQIRSAVQDDGVDRYRPLHVQVSSFDKLKVDAKAEWERDRRIAASDSLTCVVAGFETGDPALPIWMPGLSVTYAPNPVVGVYEHLGYIITAVRYDFGADSPQIAELTLLNPDAISKKALKKGQKKRA